jgi:hypothetical protein
MPRNWRLEHSPKWGVHYLKVNILRDPLDFKLALISFAKLRAPLNSNRDTRRLTGLRRQKSNSLIMRLMPGCTEIRVDNRL